jgi:hypothetical protein
MKIKIIAKTEKGNKAIEQHLKETKRFLIELLRKKLDIGFTQTVIKEKPFYYILLEYKDKIDLKKIKGVMKQNGAKPKDYCLEVE